MRRQLFDLWPVILLLLLWQLWVSTAGYSSIVLVSPGAVFSDLLRNPGAYLRPPCTHWPSPWEAWPSAWQPG